ncbi:MAG: CDP-alcohol phosphatidyltransferase family protein [Deltaproteobacteria bacterium]|nr:CDP-alcohol phosphatidyltransferase family protein [Deltaproteobacteria bacterium]
MPVRLLGRTGFIFMFNWFKTIDPLWFSLGPLLVFNVFMLGTVLYFRRVRKTQSLPDAEKYLDNRHHSKLLNKWMKEYWYWLTSPVERLAIKWGMTPNFFTSMGFLLSCLAGLAFYFGRFGMGGWLMIIGGSCDMFDGRVARATGNMTKSGAFYDSVMDRYGELVTFIGLAVFYRESFILWFVLGAIVGSTMVSYNRARGQAIGIDCDGGSMQRSERIVYLGVGSIFSPVFAALLKPLIELPLDFMLRGAIILIALMTNGTALFRLKWIFDQLDAKEPMNQKSKDSAEKSTFELQKQGS